MPSRYRRARGAWIRTARNRPLAVVAGFLLMLPAALLTWRPVPHWPWWVEAAVFVVAASGAALVLAGLGGRRPDWIADN